MAFIECLLCAQHSLDTGSITMSLPIQTRAQTSENLHSGGRGKQIITQVTCCLKPRGAFGGEKGLTAPMWERASFLGFTVDPHLSENMLTHEARTAVPVRDRERSQDWHGTSWKVPVLSCPSPQTVIPSLVLTPRVWFPNSTPQKWRGGGDVHPQLSPS